MSHFKHRVLAGIAAALLTVAALTGTLQTGASASPLTHRAAH